MMGPFTRPIVVVADIGGTRDVMMKSDFDRSSYIIDRFPLFGGSQILMHTNDSWRNSRRWLKDLLTPQYLQNVAGPHIHSSVQQLIQLWELSSRIAGPKTPFNMQLDLKDLALDVMTQFHHEEDLQDLTLKRQIQHIQQLDGDSLKLITGPSNEVTFPRASLNTFHRAVMEIADRMATIYISASAPWLISWWTQHITPHYRKLFAAKQTYIHERIDVALKRLYQGEKPKTGIEHMVYREHKAAEKAGRRPRYKDQIMVDEVRTHCIH
jgi:cytochrome P450